MFIIDKFIHNSKLLDSNPRDLLYDAKKQQDELNDLISQGQNDSRKNYPRLKEF